MSESVASVLDVLNNEATLKTQIFIRMIDRFFDVMNIQILSEVKRIRK